MHSTRNARHPAASLLIFAALALSVTGCAIRSAPTLPVVVTPPQIPSPPAGVEPLPLGVYWTRHCELVRKVQQTVNGAKLAPEPCLRLGPAKP